jgi:Fic family protein
MQWVWQLKNWPNFELDATLFKDVESQFINNIYISIGTIKHITTSDIERLTIEILTQEAISTSIIEGEILQRDSVQSSIRKQLGLQTDKRKIKPNEAGIAELIVDVYKNYKKPLTHSMLYNWHKMVQNGRRDLEVIGAYRKHKEAMQIISGNFVNNKVFYEAPESDNVKKEMNAFINWYNKNLKNETMPTIVFAGITHLYFECIHPFEDGNGRIGRALVEKAISQRLGIPTLCSFSKMIESNKKQYHDALLTCNHSLNSAKWLLYFSKIIIQAQLYTSQLIEFNIFKTKFFAKFLIEINIRQEKVLLRLFEAGIEGFQGGLSASNYKVITNTSPATATRDLQELVNIGALHQKGQLKNTRYYLNLSCL